MNGEKLLPCPFCGCDDVGTEKTVSDGIVWCRGCLAKIVRRNYGQDDRGQTDAIEAWDCRPIEQGVSEEQVEAAVTRYMAFCDRYGDFLGVSPDEEGKWIKFTDHVAALAAARLPRSEGGPTHRHKKRGTEYVLLGFGKMQAENWFDGNKVKWELDSGSHTGASADNAPVAIYRSVGDGSLYVRPKEEFEDGRFEALPTPPPAEHPPRSEGWRTMDSAPKDGTQVLLFIPTRLKDPYQCGELLSDEDGQSWWIADGRYDARYDGTPELWQPIAPPAPPKGPSHD